MSVADSTRFVKTLSTPSGRSVKPSTKSAINGVALRSNGKLCPVFSSTMMKLDLGRLLQNGVRLYHRREQNRRLQIQIAEDCGLKAAPVATLVNGANAGAEDIAELPSNIVGLDAKKLKKPVKINFHPSTLQQALRNENVAKGVCRTVNALIENFLSDWSMTEPVKGDAKVSEEDVTALHKSLLEGSIIMRYDAQSTDIRCHLETAAPAFLRRSSDSAAVAAMSSPAKAKSKRHPSAAPLRLELAVERYDIGEAMAKEARSASPIRAELEPDSSPQSRQRVQLRLTSGHTDAPQHIIELLAIDFYCYHPLIASDAAAKNSPHYVAYEADANQLHIHLSHAFARPKEHCGRSAVMISDCKSKMIDCAQLRIENLRHRVRNEQQHAARSRSPPKNPTPQPSPPSPHQHAQAARRDGGGGARSQQQQQHTIIQPISRYFDCGPVASAFHPNQRVALFQLTNTSRPLQLSRFTVVPVSISNNTRNGDDASPPTTHPLHVRIAEHVESHRSLTRINTASDNEIWDASDSAMGSGSPPDSVDSAVLSDEERDDDVFDNAEAQNTLVSPPSVISVLVAGVHGGTPPTPTASVDVGHTTPSPAPAAIKRHLHLAAAPVAPHVQLPHFRARSSSESWDTRAANICGNPLAANHVDEAPQSPSSGSGGSQQSLSPSGSATLRSILKKPKVLPPGMGSTCIVQPALQAAGQNGQLRRVATRYVLSRSVSECHDDAAAAHLLAEALGHANAGISLLDEEVVSMEDLTVAAVGGGGSTLSVCVEGDETAAEHEQAAAAAIEDDDDDASSAGSSSNDDAAASSAVRGGRSTLFEQRKKRVSFNDRVQARIYRSTSSIVADKNKAERKARNRRRRRADSEGGSESDAPGEEEAQAAASHHPPPPSSQRGDVPSQLSSNIPTSLPNAWSTEEKSDKAAFADTNSNKLEEFGQALAEAVVEAARGSQASLTPVQTRRDSGIETDTGREGASDGESNATAAPGGSPKRVQRVVSADSAFGDEMDIAE